MAEKNNNKKYSFKPLFIKANSQVATIMRPIASFTFEKGGKMIFPVFMRLHFVEGKFFPDNVCLRKSGNCPHCNAKLPVKVYAIFPAEVEGDIRLVFVPFKYLPKTFLDDKKSFVYDRYNTITDGFYQVQLNKEDNSLSFAKVEKQPTVVLNEALKKIIRGRIFPFKVFNKNRKKDNR